MALETVLEQYGLSEKEAAIYLAALELGRAPVLRIADKAAVKRPTAYVVLNELQERGLVEVVPRGSHKFYQAVDPQQLLVGLQQRARTLEQAMPQLRALLNTAGNKPQVRLFEGKRAIYQLYEAEILQQSEMFSMVDVKELSRTYSENEMLGLLDRMQASGMQAKELIDDSKEAKWYSGEKNQRGLGSTKILPKKFSFDVDFIVYGDTVVYVSLKNLVAVVVEDAAIAAAQLQLLNFLYDSIE